jgi:hypothetical protein
MEPTEGAPFPLGEEGMRTLVPTLAAVVAAIPSALNAADCPLGPVGCSPTMELEFIGRYSTGVFNNGGAEISAYHPGSKRLYTINYADSSVDVVNLANPASPGLITKISTLPYAGSPNSVATGRGPTANVVALAIEDFADDVAGKVLFLDATTGAVLGLVTVGVQPDMCTFTPDGLKLLVANEGEPSDSYSVDPPGSVSIVDLSAGVAVATVNTVGFGGVPAKLIDPEIRPYGPGATLGNDLEPEYIVVSADSSTAQVVLQEHNAIGTLDLASATFTRIRWLGTKDHGGAPWRLTLAEFVNPPVLGTTASGQEIHLGGMSGLWFDGIAANGNLKFLAAPDRGPNAEPVDVDGDGIKERPFALPGYQPRICSFEVAPTGGPLVLTGQTFLTRQDGTPLTGLPNVFGQAQGLAYTDEEPVDGFGQPLATDPLGGDIEGLVKLADGTFWMCDEYRPALYKFDATGRLVKRFVPFGSNAFGVDVGTEALPAVYAARRANRGFEAIATYGGLLYLFVQSPLDNPDVTNDNSSKASLSTRILVFNPVTETTVAEYLYRIEGAGSDKIGDAVADGPGTFLVVERDDATGPTAKKKIFRISLAGATNLATLPPAIAGPGGTLELMTPAQLAANGIVPVAKTLHVDLAAIGFADVADKVEGLALIDRSRLAVINDNDFQTGGALNTATGTFGLVDKPTFLGIIEGTSNPLDASDQDGGIKFLNWPVEGLFQPDAMASFSIGGQDYLFTANEGDSRDWSGYSEVKRVSQLTLDPVAFPNGAWLKANSRLGRLQVTNRMGDLDSDGDFDRLYCYGGRSFSIRTADGSLVWDSADLFERIVAATVPAFFNVSNDANTFDRRSANKGPEPEGVTVGELNGVPYAFVILERIGGVMVFNVANPAAPIFERWVNTRDYTQPVNTAAAGDLGPEGVLFVPPGESPDGRALVIVSNEVSGTVSIFAASPICETPGDLDGNCTVDAADLAAVLAAWGPCGKGGCPADLNGDGFVNGADLTMLLANWG